MEGRTQQGRANSQSWLLAYLCAERSKLFDVAVHHIEKSEGSCVSLRQYDVSAVNHCNTANRLHHYAIETTLHRRIAPDYQGGDVP